MSQKFRIFYDAEFTGLHRNTSLISIGMVSYCGAYFYAEFNDYDKDQVNEWLQEHVIDNLMMNDKDTVEPVVKPFNVEKEVWKHYNISMKGNTEEVKEQLLAWLKNESHNGESQIQFYTDCYAYDWVLLNDLICEDGLALNLPEYIYYIPMDLSTALQLVGYDPDISREELAGSKTVEMLSKWNIFSNMGDKCKHNSLWDAAICSWCFYAVFGKITTEVKEDHN